jgi:hypothetical protein
VAALEAELKLFLATALFIGLVAAACQTDPKEKAKANQQAMIEEAKRASAEEAAFAADSEKLAKTFEVKSIAAVKTLNFTEEDDNGDDANVQHYYFLSPDNKSCQVSAKTFTTKAVGDTINCQWSDKFEQ